MASITVPANFGLHYQDLASNDVTLQLSDGSLQASAVVLCLNSPLIKKDLINQSRALKETDPNNAGTGNEPEPGRSSLTLQFQKFEKPAVKVFLKACYSGELDTTKKETLAHIHRMAHKFQVFWIIQAVFDDYKNRVKRCLGLYDYRNAYFLFKEAISTLVDMKKRNFVDVFIQEFSSVPKTRKEFLSVYMINMYKYSAEELKVAVELSGSQVDIVVNALADYIHEFKIFDDNARCLLYNVNFLYIKERHPEAHKRVFNVLLMPDMQDTLSKKDLQSILQLQKAIQFDEPITDDKAWNKNIQLPNLFRTVEHKVDVSDELSQKMHVKTDQKSTADSEGTTSDNRPLDPADSEGIMERMYQLRVMEWVSNLYMFIGDLYEWIKNIQLPNLFQTLDSEGLTITEGSENQDSSDNESTDSSSSESENMSRFMDRMYQLGGMEQVSNLYMFIEGLYEWIKLEGDGNLGINFSDAMVFVSNIRIDRGWFPISSKFLDRLENLDNNQDITHLIEALKCTPSLISDPDNILIESIDDTTEPYCIKTILQGENDTNKIAFHFKHPRYKQCTKNEFCGFLFKLEKGTSGDDFRMELCYAESDYESMNLHFHENLWFAQRMHLTLSGHINSTCSFPLSWEGKPVLDDSGRIVRWGRHRFSRDDSDKPSPQAKMYDWQETEKARFTIYYCTA